MAKVTHLYINLPVRDVARTRAFFEAIGFAINPNFSGDNAVCVVLGDNLFAMMLVESFFKTFTAKAVADARTTIETLHTITLESKTAVDEVVAKALAAGGVVPDPPEDHGWMYQHGFYDLDGHGWGVMAITGAPPTA